MSENFISSLFRKNPEKSPQGDLNVELYGKPKQEVIEAVKNAARLAMEEMGYTGDPPPLRIAEGVIYDKYAGEIAGIFEWDTQSVVIGQGKLQSLLAEGASASDEALAALVAAEEVAHYVQYKQGRGSTELFLDLDSAKHYEHPTERERLEIYL